MTNDGVFITEALRCSQSGCTGREGHTISSVSEDRDNSSPSQRMMQQVRELQHYSSIVIRMTEEHVALPDESDELIAPAATMPLLP